MGIKRCPKCGSIKLLAKKVTGVQVESLENGEYKINAEGSKYQIEIIGCAKCKEEFDESALVEMVKCKKCGKLVEPENLDNNEECDVCRALEERPDLANMSKEDLIRMMLKLEKSTVSNTQTSVTTSTQAIQMDLSQKNEQINIDKDTAKLADEKMKIAQAAISNVSNEFTKEIIEEAKKDNQETEEMVNELQKSVDELKEAMNPPETSEESEVEKPKRKRRLKKKNNKEEELENNSSEQVSEEQVEQSANEISESQEAPFPEQDSELKDAFTESANQQMEQQPQQQFQMFEEEQSF